MHVSFFLDSQTSASKELIGLGSKSVVLFAHHGILKAMRGMSVRRHNSGLRRRGRGERRRVVRREVVGSKSRRAT
jgi:hypothetical protein